MKLTDSIILKSYTHSNDIFEINNFQLKKVSLLSAFITYLKENKSNCPDVRHGLKHFSNIQIINWEVEKVPEFYDMEKSGLINISIKPFKHFPNKIPDWIAKNGLSGFWWIINVKDEYLSKGQIHDIFEFLSLLKINDIQLLWIRDLANYFGNLIKDNVIFVCVEHKY